jgi:hypothetical protein
MVRLWIDTTRVNTERPDHRIFVRGNLRVRRKGTPCLPEKTGDKSKEDPRHKAEVLRMLKSGA